MSKIADADDDSSDVPTGEELKTLIEYYENQMKVAEDFDHPADLAKVLASSGRNTAPCHWHQTFPEIVKIFNSHIDRLEKDIATQEHIMSRL